MRVSQPAFSFFIDWVKGKSSNLYVTLEIVNMIQAQGKGLAHGTNEIEVLERKLSNFLCLEQALESSKGRKGKQKPS